MVGRLVVSVLVTCVTILIGTLVYLQLFTSHMGWKAISTDAIRALTIYYPFYWLGVLAVVVVMGLLFRRWIMAS